MNLVFETSRGKSKLNPFLVKQQNLTEDCVARILELHKEKDLLFDKIEASGDPNILAEITEVEFKLQDAWGFARDEMWHAHFRIPGCKCPVMDGYDDLGFQKHYSAGCLLHQSILK